jgi:excisionase family DNA binding protein
MAQADRILTLEEASELFKVSTKTFMKMLRDEDLPARKIGREWRFSEQALLTWMAGGHSREYALEENRVKDYFNRVAPQYNEQRSNAYGSALRDIITGQADLTAETVVADIGAGTGYIALEMAHKAKKVLAVDNSASMLAVAREEAARQKIDNIEFFEGEAETLPMQDRTVDCIVSNMLLHHVQDPLDALREMRRILKPGGRLILTDAEEHGHTWLKEEKSDLWLGFSKEELIEWLKEAGFKNIAVRDAGCDCCTGTRDGSKTVKLNILLATGSV